MAPKSGIFLLAFFFLLGETKQSVLIDTLVELATSLGTAVSTAVIKNCSVYNDLLGVFHKQVAASPKTSGILEDGIFVEIYTKTHYELFYFRNVSESAKGILANANFNKTKPTVIYTTGYMMIPGLSNADTIIASLIKRGDVNVIVFGSTLFTFLYYRLASLVSKLIGTHLGTLLSTLYLGGVSTNNIHVIGYGLGAHIAGFAGRTFANKTGVKIGRITGLDPAGPCFFINGPENILTKDDALFVDVIHTDSGVLGINRPLGHADFYPNGGSSQPNALGIAESHDRSRQYYSETVTLELQENFLAVQCPDWKTFKAGGCYGNPTEYMGYNVSTSSRGSYFLKTSGSRPFGLGLVGISAQKSPWEVFLEWLASLFGIN